MLSRSSISLGLALLLALGFAFPAFAGGWAIITLDELPTDVVAGKPLTIGFVVRQHGITPMSGLDPIVTATLQKTSNLVVKAESDGAPGHYTAIPEGWGLALDNPDFYDGSANACVDGGSLIRGCGGGASSKG